MSVYNGELLTMAKDVYSHDYTSLAERYQGHSPPPPPNKKIFYHINLLNLLVIKNRDIDQIHLVGHGKSLFCHYMGSLFCNL